MILVAQDTGGASWRLSEATLICASCFPVPFPGVKQEQLSPRSQASQPESLVMQPAQEGSILRGERAAVPQRGRAGGMRAALGRSGWIWGFLPSQRGLFAPFFQLLRLPERWQIGLCSISNGTPRHF